MALQSNALTTVARVKAMPGMSGKSDATVEEQINLASDLIEYYLGFKLGYREQTYLLQGSGTRQLVLPVAPVVEVTEVLVRDEEIDLAEVTTPNDWAEKGMLYRANFWPVAVDLANEAGDPDMSTIALPISVTLRHGWWLPTMSGEQPEDVAALPIRVQRAAELGAFELLAAPPGGRPRVKSEKTAAGHQVVLDLSATDDWDALLPERARKFLAGLSRREILL